MVDPSRRQQQTESSNCYQWVVAFGFVAIYFLFAKHRWMEGVIFIFSLVFYVYVNQQGRENTGNTSPQYTSGYLEISKYFEEEEDDAVRDKKVRLACELRDHGFDLDKVIDAARNCDNFDTATRYLMHKCDSCAKFFSLPELMSMLHCTHQICKPCAVSYFNRALDEGNISGCVCPVCKSPVSPEAQQEYLSNLGIILNEVVDLEHMQKFNMLFKKLSVKASGVDKIEEPLEMPAEKKQWECGLCVTMVDIDEMESLFPCDHKCCITCIREYFAVLLRERTINDCSCPYCDQPDLSGGDETVQFFTFLGTQLQRILDPQLHGLFTQKLLDRSLNNNPRFKWCPKCPSGFLSNPGQLRVECQECGFVSCSECRCEWDEKHYNITCEQFAQWKKDTKENEELEEYLKTVIKIVCPSCKFVFLLDRGGCMHLTCSQCKYEFCFGCEEQYIKTCDRSCRKYGLHAHHPKNCLYYLRDKEPSELQQILTSNGLRFCTKRDGQGETCDIQVRNETPNGLTDSLCGLEAPQEFAGFCKKHYIEYLWKIIWDGKIDISPLGQATNAGPQPESSKGSSVQLETNVAEYVV